jgi:hypothetical protein
MDKVMVDEQKTRAVGFLMHHVIAPDFVVEGMGHQFYANTRWGGCTGASIADVLTDASVRFPTITECSKRVGNTVSELQRWV